MTLIGQRIIAYLKTDATLIGATLLGSANGITVIGAPERINKYVAVGSSAGEEQDYIPADIDTIDIIVGVGRDVANAHKLCIDIAKKVDDLLNKKEDSISATGYTVHLFTRKSMSDLAIDTETNEYWILLTYDYILEIG